MSDEKIYQLALHLTNGLGSVLVRQLIAHFGSAQKIFQANLKSLTRVNGIGEATARIILQKKDSLKLKKNSKSSKQRVANCFFILTPNFLLVSNHCMMLRP